MNITTAIAKYRNQNNFLHIFFIYQQQLITCMAVLPW